MKYAEIVAAERRHVILQLLHGAGGTSSERALYTALDQLRIDGRLMRDDVTADLRWLKERKLVVLDMVDDTTMAATITELGEAVLRGRREVEGVLAPKGI